MVEGTEGMSRIVALRGVDDAGCGCSGMGADAAIPPPPGAPPAAPMTTQTMLIWAAVIGTAGYIFYATLQGPKRRRKAA